MTTQTTRLEITDKIYDENLDPDACITLRCRQCGDEDTLVESTFVPRSMGAMLFENEDGDIVANLVTSDDDAFWEGEFNHVWGCRTCVNEDVDINKVFERI